MRLINKEDLMQTLGITTDMDCEKCGWYSRTARRCKRGSDFEDACFAIENAPTIEPEIVRCKDCKHRIEHKHYGDFGESAYTCEGNMDGWILPDDFCSLAERRTDE